MPDNGVVIHRALSFSKAGQPCAYSRYSGRDIWTQAALLIVLAIQLTAQTGTPSITLSAKTQTAPPGAITQIQVIATAPALITEGALSIDFDPSVFGNIQSVAAFSATGDAIGYANVNGQHLDAHFSSPSGSIGQLPGLPILVISIPVLSSAASGNASAITVDPTIAPWHDSQGNTYKVSANPSTLSVGGALYIGNVAPGGGLIPAGTILTIAGGGFEPNTTVAIDGVSVSSTQQISPTHIEVTLGGSTEMTARHVHLTTSTGAVSDFFTSLPSAPANNVTTPKHLFLPLATYKSVTWEYPATSPSTSESIALLNQDRSPVTTSFFFTTSSGTTTIHSPIDIPPGSLYLLPTSMFTSGLGLLGMIASTPIRMAEYRSTRTPYSSEQIGVSPPTPLTGLPPLLQPSVSPSGSSWQWQVGTPAPAAADITIAGTGSFTATVSPSAAPWLKVSPAQGTVPSSLTLTPNFTSLSPGTYTGTVTLRVTLPDPLSIFTMRDIVLPVSVQVSASPFIAASGNAYFSATPGSSTPIATTLTITSTGAPVQFTASVSTNSVANWLSITPANGTTPGSLTLSANPSGLAAGSYPGTVIIQGPANTIALPVRLDVQSPRSTNLSTNPPSLTFALSAGTSAPQAPQLVFVQPTFDFQILVETQSGGNWLTAAFKGALSVSASAVGLTPGTYYGTITLTSPANGSVQIPVTLVVLEPASPLTVSPSSLAFTIAAGASATQSFTVTSSAPTLFHVTTFTPGGEQWIRELGINSNIPSSSATPATSLSP